MSETYPIRKRLLDIARRDVGKKEVEKNRGEWIKKLWLATSYGMEGYVEREPYCAAGVAYCVQEWLKDPQVLSAFGFTAEAAERWRCKSASAFKDANSWLNWARKKGLQILSADAEFHAGDLIIFKVSHIEIYVTDAPDNEITNIGYNTSPAGSRDGGGCYEKPRSRAGIKCAIRLLS